MLEPGAGLIPDSDKMQQDIARAVGKQFEDLDLIPEEEEEEEEAELSDQVSDSDSSTTSSSNRRNAAGEVAAR